MSKIRIRPAVSADLDAIIDLETRAMHFPMGHRVREWFRDDFPFDFRKDFAVAEHEGRIVSAAALIPLEIRYRGITLRAAYWEAVVTDEEFRRFGLCRRLFDHLTPRGTDALFVWGATWLYRRFGYFPALRNAGMPDSRKRVVRVADIPDSPLTSRPACPDDAPFLSELRLVSGRRYVVSVPVSEAKWRYDLRPDRTVAGPGEAGLNRWQEWRILEREGQPVGYFMHDPWDLACLMEVEVIPGAATWQEAAHRAVHATAAFVPGATEVSAALPDGHPIFAELSDAFGPPSRAYGDIAARIPDLAGLLWKVAPALEANLASSSFAGWTGELTVSRIESGARLQFESGRLVESSPWSGEHPDRAMARFMPGRVEALVFGYRSLEEILQEDADCRVDEAAEGLLTALFPPGESFLRPI